MAVILAITLAVAVVGRTAKQTSAKGTSAGSDGGALERATGLVTDEGSGTGTEKSADDSSGFGVGGWFVGAGGQTE